MGFSMKDYQEVPERIEKFYEVYPEGRLTSRVWFERIDSPRTVRVINDEKDEDDTYYDQSHQIMVICEAKAYRTPDDPAPCVGLASEPFPGLTQYTRDSEVSNAETSAWGRAIVATGVTKAKKVASASEVRNRSGEAPATASRKTRTVKPTTTKATAATLDGTVDEPAPEGWDTKEQATTHHRAARQALNALPKDFKAKYAEWDGPKGHKEMLPKTEYDVWAQYIKDLVGMATLAKATDATVVK